MIDVNLIRLIKASLLLLSALPQAYANPRQPSLRVAVIAPLSGDYAQFGQGIVNGLQLGMRGEQRNKLSLVVEDNRNCTGPEAVSAYQKILSGGKVDVLVTVCTAAAQSLLPIVKRGAIPMIQVTEPGADPDGYMIKMMPGQGGSMAVLANYFAEKYQTMAIIADIQTVNEGAQGSVAQLRQAFAKQNRSVVYQEMVSSDQLDFRAILPKIKSVKADVVVPILGTAAQMAAFLRQADDFHLWEDSALGGNWTFEFLFEKLKDLYPRIATLNGLESNNLVQKKDTDFVRRYQELYREVPAQFADYGYDVGTMLRICGAELTCLLSHRPGASGDLYFDEHRQRAGEYQVKRLKNGKFTAFP